MKILLTIITGAALLISLELTRSFIEGVFGKSQIYYILLVILGIVLVVIGGIAGEFIEQYEPKKKNEG